MKQTSLYFTAPRTIELREALLPEPVSGEVRVRAICSAISTGTEMLIYKGEAPGSLAADDSLPALPGSLAFPLKYGYCMVGRVDELGAGVVQDWLGRIVFTFNPHETAFNARLENLLFLSDKLSEQDAAFLPSAETAVNLILDGEPRLGERVVVLGAGIIGLLTTALLAQHPLESLIVFDRFPVRRELAAKSGAKAFDPQDGIGRVQTALGPRKADLVYELTGNPEALNLAMELVGEHGRIIVGSWYGERRASLNLGAQFHRGRVRIISSQVSQIEPALRGRWDRQRRFEQAWKLLGEVRPAKLFDPRVLPFKQAADAYKLLDTEPDKNLAILLSYT